MKKLILVSAIAMSGLFFNTANAQIRLHVGVRLFGPRPVYVAAPAPVVADAPVYQDNYQADDNSDDDYYYLPDIGAYYDVTAQCYYYFDGDNWISAAYLPGYDQSFDWRSVRRYEVRERRPYMRNDFYMQHYKGNDGNWARNTNRNDRDNRNYSAYVNHDQRFDNRDNHTQQFDNRRNDNRDNRQFNQNQDRNRGNDSRQSNQNQDRNKGNDSRQSNQNQSHGSDNSRQQRVAQNDRGYSGHNAGRNRF